MILAFYTEGGKHKEGPVGSLMRTSEESRVKQKIFEKMTFILTKDRKLGIIKLRKAEVKALLAL